MRQIDVLKVERDVSGLAILNNQLYVGYYEGSSDIEVYETTDDKLAMLSTIEIPELAGVQDIVSCGRYQCIYVADSERETVFRIQDENRITSWPTNDKPDGCSVNVSYNLLVTCCDVGKVKEFTTDGQLIREIKLHSDIVHPQHAVQLTANRFVVCHGWEDDLFHRVCLVDDVGEILLSYGGNAGPGDGQLNRPVRLELVNGFILAVDHINCRVLMLDPKLNFVRQLMTGVAWWRLCANERHDRMCTYAWDEKEIRLYSM